MPVKVVYLVWTNEGLTSNTRIHNPDNRMLDFAGHRPDKKFQVIQSLLQ